VAGKDLRVNESTRHAQAKQTPGMGRPAAPRTGGAEMMSVAGISVDLAMIRTARKAILVEGDSDKAALDTLARRRGQVVGCGGIQVVAMGGATSIGPFLQVLGPRGINVRLGGLCDAGQERYIRTALMRAGLGCGPGRDGLEACGFYVCTDDLEDELIRAVGTAAVEQIIQEQGEMRPLRTFQHQPAQRGRSTSEQFHRFIGTRSGRKSQYARLLAQTLDLACVPRPLDLVLADR
jgi:hypothetical protein